MRLRVVALFVAATTVFASAQRTPQHLLYVAQPASDDAAGDRSVGLAVFDIDNGHRFVKRIALWRAARGGAEETVRGVAASRDNARLYLATTTRLAAIDLKTEKVVWSRSFDDHCCDRLAVSPDGRTIYAPAFGRAKWYVVAADTGTLRTSVTAEGWARSAAYAPDGRRAFLAAWESRVLTVVDALTDRATKTVGPFTSSLCPFTLNARGTLAFANVDGLVGFEVGDLETGLVLDRVVADRFDKDAALQYECPSHGIAFAPGERELWIADGVANRLVVFDATVYPPVQRAAVDLKAQPRWIAFSADGRYAYPSTGDVVDTATKAIVGALEASPGVRVNASVLVQIDRSSS